LCRHTTRLTAMVPGSLVTTAASIATVNARFRRAEAAYDDALSQGADEAGALIAARIAYQEATADAVATPLTCTTHNNVYQFWYDNIVVNGAVRLVIEPQLWYNVSSGSSCNHNFYQPEQLIDITNNSPKVSFVYSVIV